MKILKKFLFRQAERRLKKVPALYRGQARFELHYPGKYSFGVGSYGLPKVHDWDEGATLHVGAYCSIALNVQILLGGHHHSEWLTTYPFSSMVPGDIPPCSFSRGDVVIGNDVWLCSNTIVLSGVTIGDGAIVSAGSVVTKDVEPYSIVAGNPAQHVRWRFDPVTRAALLETAWWTWPAEEVSRVAPMLCSGNIDSLLEYAKQRKCHE
ncbi:MAG: CatB-related O-acetyltransferase [Gammaproteobacteria bacterium]|nr:CatB-related O-acetyltransferase [Gammaproteobacteria bacterium]MBU1600573.1 CatB-related O-acetyltransferase [Gammaproteobacteria bacterium]MBU2435029.1 CatB-related O-acetyltransferase [Gammaproteobacteria bacterium]MBU2448265.1 CatB-related O-acetyltransferase [Gammaproteobacteria bacterium]